MVFPPNTYLTPIYCLPVAIIALAFDVPLDEGGGVNAFDDREGCCVLTRFVGVAGLFALTGAASVGAGVIVTSSGETASAVCMVLGYKSPIVAWIVFGLPITVVGPAVIIVTNKNAEMTGSKRRVCLFLIKFLILNHPFFCRGVGFHGLTTNN